MRADQLKLLDYQPPAKTPDFGGDFEREMDWISSLPEEERIKLFDREKDKNESD